MTIHFLIGASSRIRNFEQTISILAGRGHTLVLAGRPRKGRIDLPKSLKAPGVSIRENPTARADDWDGLVDTLRGARDYVRYLDPRFAPATRLVRRAYEISPTEFVLFCERHAWLKRRWRLLSAILARCEDLIPSPARFEAFIRGAQPDLILVTPLVTFESYQTDYVKAAHRLGIPIAFLPFSWDNLTNKGLMRIHPDRVLVWNELQRQEAIDLHGVPADRVRITGASRFDDFFARTPSRSRDEFCALHGLDPARPMVLYLGSSQLTGPNEMELVRQWVEALRRASDPALRACSILVRPHPALKSSWVSVDLSMFGRVAIELHARRSADQELYDSLHYAHVAVGLNTSAMLEAAIVGRPVHTLLIPGFDEGQVGTIHFRYLVEAFGGLVTIARSFDEHIAQLGAVLGAEPVRSPRSRAFAERFLRPHGIDCPVSPLLAEAIEAVGAIRKRPASFTPPWQVPARAVLRAWMRRFSRGRNGGLGGDTSPVATSMSLRPVRTALEEMRQESGPILVGPWLDSVEKELLYWIPFTRWASRTYGLSSDRLIVISRDGARQWYGPLAGRFLDARSLVGGPLFDEWAVRSIPQSQQNPKVGVVEPFDQDILQRAAAESDAADPPTLHPQMFFRVLQRLQGDAALSRLHEVLSHERTSVLVSPDLRSALPLEYVAASFAGTSRLPEHAEHRARLRQTTREIAGRRSVVVIDDADGAMTVEGESGLEHRLPPFGPLGWERLTQVLSGAQAFVGPYGDLAVLASSCGVPTHAFHAEAPSAELALLRAVADGGRWGPVAFHQVSSPAALISTNDLDQRPGSMKQRLADSQ